MPRTLQEILDHADQLEARFAEHEPNDLHDATPLRAIREAVTQRAATERHIAEAVAAAREAPACPGPPSVACSAPPE